ncbi:hypothetical protein XENTR_v10010350 [Xenopus tropicalis]|nr:hypothetical protein XENTR_v10010350 [Xenopus tropicalis]
MDHTFDIQPPRTLFILLILERVLDNCVKFTLWRCEHKHGILYVDYVQTLI